MVRLLAFIFFGCATFTSVLSATTTSTILPDNIRSEGISTSAQKTFSSISSQLNYREEIFYPVSVDSADKLKKFTDAKLAEKNTHEPNIFHSIKRKLDSLDKISRAKKMANILNKKYTMKKTRIDGEHLIPKDTDANLKGSSVGILEFTSRLSRSSLRFPAEKQLHSTLPQYLKDGAVFIPPFPESEPLSTISQTEQGKYFAEGSEDISYDDSSSGETQKPLKTFTIVNPQKTSFLLSPKEESIFQPLPFKNYGAFQAVPPFPELHALSQNPHRDPSEKKEDGPLFVKEENSVPERAGHELYPSSVFERELSVPFF